MNQYETVFIMTPVLTDEMVKETVEKFKKVLEENSAEITNEENWGLKKMAYSIQKKKTGFYHLLEFKAPGPTIEPFEVELKRDERILRFLTVKMDKYHIAFAEKRRLKNSQSEQTKKEEVKND